MMRSNLARGARKSSAAGFVNAVLRGTLRQKHQLPLPTRPTISTTRARCPRLSRHHAFASDWLVRRWLRRYGFEATERWVQFNNDTPSLTLRANRLRTTRDDARRILEDDGVETEPSACGAGRLDRRDGKSAAALAGRPRSSCRTRRRNSWRLPSMRGRASGSWTCARRRAARRQRSPRPWATAGSSSRPICGRGGCDCCIETVRLSGSRTLTSCRCRRRGPLPFTAHLRLRARRCALLGARHRPARS